MTSSCVGKVSISKRGLRIDASMPWQVAGGLALWLLMLPVIAGQSEAPSERQLYELFDDCISRQVRAVSAPGFDRPLDLEITCPSLGGALGESPLGKWIRPTPGGDMTLDQLVDLRHLVARMSPPEETNWTLNYSGLDALLAQTLVRKEGGDELGWWDRFLAWLEGLIREQDDADVRWLLRLLQALTPSAETAKFILYGSLVTLVLVAVGIVFNELRAAGIVKVFRQRSHRRVSMESADTGAGASVLSPQGIRRLALVQQPAALLKLCIDQLICEHRLPDDKSLTNREFCLYLRSQHHEIAVRFTKLADYAERSVYGGGKVDQSIVDQRYSDADALLSDSSTPKRHLRA